MKKITSEQAMLQEVITRIRWDTIKWIDANAEVINYGTDGAVRYQQEADINGQRVMVYWDTTEEYDRWSDAYDKVEMLAQPKSDRNLTSDEQEELNALLKDDPRDNGYYLNDESNNCDWDNPIAVQILD